MSSAEVEGISYTTNIVYYYFLLFAESRPVLYTVFNIVMPLLIVSLSLSLPLLSFSPYTYSICVLFNVDLVARQLLGLDAAYFSGEKSIRGCVLLFQGRCGAEGAA